MYIIDYPSNLTEKQWSFIENIIEPNKKRKRRHSLYEIFNAILYVAKSDCQWRMLPANFALWNTVYFYYRKWKFEGVIEEIHEFLRSLVRKKQSRQESPSLGIIRLAQRENFAPKRLGTRLRRR